ncbi:hypothetical protein [Peribacillus simplex]|uniref:hypothetical protein n=1 Tax=Peribacillus simplex TaxID=1478 RepID=UPI00296EEDC6|nr:hypothetical protein [Peribacillus simplex]
MSEKVTLSTGVLRKEPGTVSAVVNLVNLDDNQHRVTVEVWNWSSYSNPVKLPVLIGNNIPVNFPYGLAPENLAVMYTNLSGVLFYEIRIIHSKEKNIITNCFGRSGTLVAQEGNTVLDHQLVKVDLD